ncbi:MAG: ATP-binding protein [Muribaculaceae bacterium]|jgi:SpoVK/Ycf46/Vps4 family AAA+-type ATPase|nr:ATP-binding protein [Muribaculaceae bacterium]
MILNINKPFNKCEIEHIVDTGNCNYREVYIIHDKSEKQMFLTVYSIDEMPESMNHDDIKEFTLCESLANGVFPKFISKGQMKYDKKAIKWMTTEYQEMMPLRTLVNIKPLSVETSLNIIFDILVGLKEIKHNSPKSGHFNICPDTIFVTKENNGNIKTHLRGLQFVDDDTNNNIGIDTKLINNCFRAPETFPGLFYEPSMVYSLAMLLAYMAQGFYPLKIDESMNSFSCYSIKKRGDLNLTLPKALKAIVVKAMKRKISERYQTIELFGQALAKQMRNKHKDVFSCFSNETNDKNSTHKGNSKKDVAKKSPTKEETDSEEGMKEISKQSHDFQVNVPIQSIKGVGFGAVAGMTSLKQRLIRDFVDVVNNHELASEFNISAPNILFYGPPGTGKTYISMRLAEECGLETSYVKPSDLGSIYIHGSQAMIRELFDNAETQAKENGKGVLIIFDEFDAFCPVRTSEDRNNQSGEVAEFLTQLNNSNERNIFVIGTTNCLDRIDKAIIRKGRMDEVIYIGLPDVTARKEMFELELTKRPHEESIDLSHLAELTDKYSSSDISFIIQETARQSFAKSLCNANKELVKISQAMVESVISQTRPSVSPQEMRKYEQIRDEYAQCGTSQQRHVGFIA